MTEKTRINLKARGQSAAIVMAMVLCSASIAPSAQAAMPVIDASAIVQLKLQIDALHDQLSQAEATYESLTGGRGMESLLAGTQRNYLPPDWVALDASARSVDSAYRDLADRVNGLIATNAVLSPEQVAQLSAEERAELEAARRTAAMLQVTTGEALDRTSGRFDSLQQLIVAIAAAQDPKAIMDLNARIGAEQTMLQNEQTKLMLLFQAAQAEEWSRRQRSRERAVANIGSLRDLPAIGLSD